MHARLVTWVAALAVCVPLRAQGSPSAADRSQGTAASCQRITRQLSTSVQRVCNVATLTSVAETGLQLARQAGTHEDLRRARRVSRRVGRIARGGKTLGSFGRRITRVAGKVGRATRPLTRVVNTVFGISSVGLIVDAGIRLHRPDKDQAERLSATRDLGAGISGLGRLGTFMRPLSAKLGVIGGGLQAGVGACNVVTGLRRNDRELLISGTLDLCGGGLFVASALSIGGPYALFGGAALTAGRLIYDNRARVREVMIGAWGKARAKLSHLAARLDRRSDTSATRRTSRIGPTAAQGDP